MGAGVSERQDEEQAGSVLLQCVVVVVAAVAVVVAVAVAGVVAIY